AEAKLALSLGGEGGRQAGEGALPQPPTSPSSSSGLTRGPAALPDNRAEVLRTFPSNVIGQLPLRIVHLFGHFPRHRLPAAHLSRRRVEHVMGLPIEQPAFAQRLGDLVAEGRIVLA